MKLDGKVAIITGSTTGIGNAIAKLFAREGASVVINCHADQPLCERIADEINKEGGKAIGISADVSIESEVENLVKKAVEKFGHLDIMVNNAGILSFHQITEMTEEQWDKLLAVNLKGVFFGVKHAAKQMIKQGNGGKIVNMTSIAGLIGFPGLD